MAVELLSVSDVARELTDQFGQDIRPRDISRLLYDRELRDDLCPIVSGRRVIPRDYLPMIVMVLRRRGWLQKSQGGGA